jgi:hypothetical protein
MARHYHHPHHDPRPADYYMKPWFRAPGYLIGIIAGTVWVQYGDRLKVSEHGHDEEEDADAAAADDEEDDGGGGDDDDDR